MAKEKSVEVAFEELENIIKKLETENVTLEQSFKLYNEGVNLLKHCTESLDKIEKQIIILNEDGNI